MTQQSGSDCHLCSVLCFFGYIMLCVIMLSVIMLSVIMLSVIMLSVIMLRVIMLSVMAPLNKLFGFS